jgi:hypothetical protein
MPYSNFILQQSEYTYSVNIQFDIENDRKLARFIPNETTIDLLRGYFVDIAREKSNTHSRILYGSYGTGKSHFLTVLSLLLGKMYTDGVAYAAFLRRVRSYDDSLAHDIDSFVKNENRKPYLIVPIVFDFDNFERSIYFSLRKALEQNGIDIKFKTFYTYALSLLGQWKNNQESLTRLVDACKKERTTVDKLETQLTAFNKKSEKTFRAVFSSMTFGVEFLYEASNIVENLNETNEAIKNCYSGIVFIFDEFGRYLEDNIKTIKIKSVQDLAEYCDHSDYDDHIILVSHKEIGQYTKAYGKSLVNEWKKVEGRFQATPINDRQDQCLSLIRNILDKEEVQWNAFRERFAPQLERLYTEAMDFKGFLVNAAVGDNPFEGGFPLHPITLFALDRLSKKVAQNERTFFTYLASQEEHSLYRFLNRAADNEFHFVGIDEIYDYFEPSIKAVQSDESYEWYRKLASSLSKAKLSTNDNTPEVKILKLLTVVGIINDGSAFSADKKTILSVLDEPKEVLLDALNLLITQKVVKYNGPNDRYEFFDGSIFDVDKMLEDEMSNINDELVCKTLNDSFVDFVLYPYQYNQTYKIKRVFVPVFTTAEEMTRKTFLRQIPEYYDGILAMVFGKQDDDRQYLAQSIQEVPRIITIVNNNCNSIVYEVKKYIAVLCLEGKKSTLMEEDPAIENELKYYKMEQASIISRLIHEWKSLQTDATFVVCDGQVRDDCNSFETVGTLSSELMFRAFPDTLIVNNELVNKNILSGTLSSAKKTAIRAILKDEKSDEYFGLSYLSPEYICIRSVLAKNGFYQDANIRQLNTLNNGEVSSAALMHMISEHIAGYTNKPVQVKHLYDALRNSPYGLREGYLSLLLAYILMPYRKGLIINSHEVDQEITAELFEEMIKRPADFIIYITDWSHEQLEYLDNIELLFNGYINKNALLKNRLKAIYDGMFLHYKTVSKFSRTTEQYVSDITKSYRKLMEQTHTNYSKFFFEKLRKIGGDYSATNSALAGILTELKGAPERLETNLKEDVFSVLCEEKPKNISVAVLLFNLYQSEWKVKSKKSFDYYTNMWLEMVSKIHPNTKDDEIITIATKLLTGFEPLYWNDTHRQEFITRLRDIKTRLNTYKSDEKLQAQETKMTLKTAIGEEKEIIFQTGELSSMSKTMKNKIKSALGNFGQSISYEDKVQVLLSVLEDILEDK